MKDIRQDEAFLKTLTVLYVEDDEDTAEQLGMFLSRRVGTLVTANDGASGLEKFRGIRPQMVVTDIQMPEMDGLAMAKEIHLLDPGVPIIVTTAFEETGYLKQAIEVGIEKYVAKPIDVDKLLTAMLQSARQLRAERIMRQLSAFDQQSLRLEALETVTAGMAHDFEIMSISLGQALAGCGEDSELRRHIELALNSCDRAASLGRTLQGVARDTRPMDCAGSLSALVRKAVETALSGSAISLRCDFEAGLPAVVYNTAQMRMVFAELASNARKAMPSGGTLCVTAGDCRVTPSDALPLPEGRYLHVCVSDKGTGIAPQDLPRIFDPYWSRDPMGTRKSMGLGLTLCYTILKRHNGFIVAESKPDAGASFHLYLPAAPQACPAPEIESAPVMAGR